MTDFSEMMKQAKQMQEQLQKAQQDLAKQVVDGESGAGLVQVSMNGSLGVHSILWDSAYCARGPALSRYS